MEPLETKNIACETIEYRWNTIQYNTIQHNMVQHNTTQYNGIPMPRRKEREDLRGDVLGEVAVRIEGVLHTQAVGPRAGVSLGQLNTP